MMINFLKVIILGIIEGITEFLPISSTGHLIIANEYLNFSGDFGNLFAVVIQSGAIVSVLVYFKDKVFPKKETFKSKEAFYGYISLWLKVVVGVIPAGVLALLFEEAIDQVLFKTVPVAIALIVGAILLLIVENRDHKNSVTNEDNITYKQALLVGIFQCLALFPGMSRSASTIIGGLIIGFNRKVAAEFSFFLAIPILLGASFIKLIKLPMALTQIQVYMLALGTIVSFIVAYAVIAGLMHYIKRHDFKVFAYYRIVLGGIILIMHIL